MKPLLQTLPYVRGSVGPRLIRPMISHPIQKPAHPRAGQKLLTLPRDVNVLGGQKLLTLPRDVNVVAAAVSMTDEHKHSQRVRLGAGKVWAQPC
jgi:hypothetical protein